MIIYNHIIIIYDCILLYMIIFDYAYMILYDYMITLHMTMHHYNYYKWLPQNNMI